jgi:hypothetical protein
VIKDTVPCSNTSQGNINNTIDAAVIFNGYVLQRPEIYTELRIGFRLQSLAEIFGNLFGTTVKTDDGNGHVVSGKQYFAGSIILNKLKSVAPCITINFTSEVINIRGSMDCKLTFSVDDPGAFIGRATA